MNGVNIKGDFGLGAGTQAPPGPYYGTIFYWYGTDTINDRDGNRIFPTSGGSSLNVVTKQKVLGANYGFAIAPVS